MAKIKHIALTTHDLEKVASFYKDAFGMAEVGRGGSTHIYLSDGDLNLTIRACKKSDDPDVGEQGEDFSGIHHIGFEVESLDVIYDKLAAAGAERRHDVEEALGVGHDHRPNVEVKFRGPDGIMLDVSETGWVGTSPG